MGSAQFPFLQRSKDCNFIKIVSDKLSYVELAETCSLDLCQGSPDFSPPQHVKECLSRAALSDDPADHQYTRSAGKVTLTNALAKLFSKLWNRQMDSMNEILITPGAFSAIYAVLRTCISPGDEVIIIEPFFMYFTNIVEMAGGVPVYTALKHSDISQGDKLSSNDFILDPEELESKFTSKTKMILLNTPNNPTGKVYSREELEMIATLCKKYDVMVLADEVYMFQIYDGSQHVSMATLPGMWTRTITVGTAGKMFGATGCKLGWCIGPRDQIKACAQTGRIVWANTPTIMQEGLAQVLEIEISHYGTSQSFLQSIATEMAPRRHVIAAGLKELGIKPIIPDGGYFLMCDVTAVKEFNQDDDATPDGLSTRFSSWLAKTLSIGVMPGMLVYCPESQHLASKYVRVCFYKKESTLQKCTDTIKTWKATKK